MLQIFFHYKLNVAPLTNQNLFVSLDVLNRGVSQNRASVSGIISYHFKNIIQQLYKAKMSIIIIV